MLSISLLVIVMSSNAQKISEYKAGNGVIYKLGDTVKLGRGSGQDGWFVYMLPNMVNTSYSQRDWFKRKFTNTAVVLKKIEIKKKSGIDRCMFIVGGGAMYNFHLNIEEAISTCEVLPCLSNNTNSIADEILKLKNLKDAGAITNDEFEKQKKKILGQ